MMEVEIAHTAAELRAWTDAHERLARSAAEPNVFHEPWMLAPALEHLSGAEVIVVGVRDRHGLAGVFPLAPGDRVARLPVAHTAIWRHRLCFSHGCGPDSPIRYVASFLGLRRLRQWLRRLVYSPEATFVGSICFTIRERWSCAMASSRVSCPPSVPPVAFISSYWASISSRMADVGPEVFFWRNLDSSFQTLKSRA